MKLNGLGARAVAALAFGSAAEAFYIPGKQLLAPTSVLVGENGF